MQAEYLSYKDTNSFSKLMIDYLSGDSQLNQFLEFENSIEGFRKIIASRNDISVDRKLLVERLKVQNSEINLSSLSQQNIFNLKGSNTFTITTGHQLNYFTGPLYYIYKTASIIKLCKELSTEFPDNNFVPTFWMATEDHDFEEISNFQFKDEKLSMATAQKGGVGRMVMDEIEIEYNEFVSKLGNGDRAEYLKKLFSDAYLNSKTLADVTRFIVNELFGEYGIVIIDGDDVELKKQMIPAFKRELTEFTSDKNLKETNSKLQKLNYKVQVNQREINLFYLKGNFRERIIFDGDNYKVLNSEIVFSKEEIIVELENNPERFSPNAILRPLYEEQILPNLAYVGGGGELAYWFQLKQNFNDFGVSFPILVLRNSLMLINAGQQKSIEKSGITVEDLFTDLHSLIKNKVIENSTSNLDLSDDVEKINKELEEELKINEGNSSIHPTLRAKHKKQLNAIKK
ncbi:MAG: bacillithiol biosynthesis cysteine-adding enzyme BshC, partial [Flavobacteriales bacterium]|nr:bacillithiol biosynthesis cysteine-adding enzyme BshC [Flavobacteriales bacterium]